MFLPNGSIMLQIIDVSKKVLLDKENLKTNLLTIISATVSHDMRNPLNSIIAMNMKNKELFNQLQQMVIDDDLDKFEILHILNELN